METYNATPEQSIKEFRSRKNGNQNEKDERLTGMVCMLLLQQYDLNVDIDMFDGNPLEFNYFMWIYEEMLESEVVNQRGILTGLINYTKGEVQKLVKYCIQQRTECKEPTIMKRYGDLHKILLT